MLAPEALRAVGGILLNSEGKRLIIKNISKKYLNDIYKSY